MPLPYRLTARALIAYALAALACNTSPREPAAPPPPAQPALAIAQPPSAAVAAPAPNPAHPPQVPSPAPAPAPAICTVAAVGDSLTDPRSGGGGYLKYIQARCPQSRFDNFGVGGEMVNQMRARFERELFAAGSPAYSHVVVFGGVNDLYSDLTAGRVPSKISRDLAWMYARAREAGARVVALTVAPWGGFSRYYNPTRARATLELNGWIQRQVPDAADDVIDTYALLSCGDPERLCPEYARPHRDGLHFGRLGHEKLGQALYERVFAGCL